MLRKSKSWDGLDAPDWACLPSGTSMVNVSYGPYMAAQSGRTGQTIFNSAPKEFLGTYRVTAWWDAVRKANDWKEPRTKSWEMQSYESSEVSRKPSKGSTREREFWPPASPPKHGTFHYKSSQKLPAPLPLPCPTETLKVSEATVQKKKKRKMGERWGNRVRNEKQRTTSPSRLFNYRRPKLDQGEILFLKLGSKFWE